MQRWMIDWSYSNFCKRNDVSIWQCTFFSSANGFHNHVIFVKKLNEKAITRYICYQYFRSKQNTLKLCFLALLKFAIAKRNNSFLAGSLYFHLMIDGKINRFIEYTNRLKRNIYDQIIFYLLAIPTKINWFVKLRTFYYLLIICS